MATYKLKGKRFLKKYSAPRSSPVYAASVDAAAIVERLCSVPWEESSETEAGLAFHTGDVIEETGKPGFDSNTIQREHLDAAAWCANHSGGQHRAFANAACYVFELPDAQSYPSLTSLKAKVTSDPYNSSGVRLAVHTNSTGEIPINCATARTGAAHAERVAPRTVETVSGTDYWYPTTAECTISPDGGLQLQKYILLVVAIEDYSTVRGNWIEGSAFINPQIEITTSAAISGWTDGEAVDAVPADGGVVVVEGFSGDASRVDSYDTLQLADCALVSANGTPRTTGEDGRLLLRDSANQTPVNLLAAVRQAYALCHAGQMLSPGVVDDNQETGAWVNSLRIDEGVPGAAFCVCVNPNLAKTGLVQRAGGVLLSRRVALYRFVVPLQRAATMAQFDWQPVATSGRAKFTAWLKIGNDPIWYDNTTIRDIALYTATEETCGDWLRLASITNSAAYQTAGAKTLTARIPFALPAGSVATILLTAYAEPDGSTFEAGDVIGMTKDAAGNDIASTLVGVAGWRPTITLI